MPAAVTIAETQIVVRAVDGSKAVFDSIGTNGTQALNRATAAAGGFTAATERMSVAQRTLHRALDVGGNLVKGFLTSLAIAPVLALGSALATAALEMLGIGDAAEKAAPKVDKLKEAVDSLQESLTKLQVDERIRAALGQATGGPSALTAQRDAMQGLFTQIAQQSKPLSSDQSQLLAQMGLSYGGPGGGAFRPLDVAEALRQLTDAIQSLDRQIAFVQKKPLTALPAASGMPFDIFPQAGGIPPSVMAAWMKAQTSTYHPAPGTLGGYNVVPALEGLTPSDALGSFLSQNKAPGWDYAAQAQAYSQFLAAGGVAGMSGVSMGPPVPDEVKAQQEAEKRAALETATAWTSAGEQAIDSALLFGETTQQIFRQLEVSLAQALIHEGVAAGVTALFAANGAVWPGGFKAFAGGGVASTPTLGVVGEGQYPEAIIPMPDGKTVPVTIRGAGSGVTVHVHMQLQAIDTQDFKAHLRENMREVGDIVARELSGNGPLVSRTRRAARTRR
jgi:hypothetical protein